MKSRLVHFLLVLTCACGELADRQPGAPCTDDSMCDGACWRGQCHATEPFDCDPSVKLDLPCLRERQPDEHACQEVREGRLFCMEGRTTCRATHRDWREVASNGCDDDQDAVVDEAHGECDSSRERTYFSDLEGVPRLVLDTTVARYHSAGESIVDFFDEQEFTRAAWIAGNRPWTYTSDCPIPADPAEYRGRWITWELPELPRSARFSIEFLQFVFAQRVGGATALSPTISMVVRSPDGELYRPLPAEVLGFGGVYAARWTCVPLQAGVSTVFVFNAATGGCPCEADQCSSGSIFAPTDLILDQRESPL